MENNLITMDFDNVLGNMGVDQLQQLTEKIRDERMKKNEFAISVLHNDFKQLDSKFKLLDEENKELNNKYTKLADLTYVLATDDVKAEELIRLIKKQAFKGLGKGNGMGSVEYLLFYRKYISNIHSRLKENFQVPKYSRIKIDDYDEALNIVKGWFPERKLKKAIENEYFKQMEKGILKKEKEVAFNIYLAKINQ